MLKSKLNENVLTTKDSRKPILTDVMVKNETN